MAIPRRETNEVKSAFWTTFPLRSVSLLKVAEMCFCIPRLTPPVLYAGTLQCHQVQLINSIECVSKFRLTPARLNA